MTKVCARCLSAKPESEFRKDKYKKDGLKIVCKLCDSVIQSESYFRRRELALQKIKEWQQENLDKVRGYKRKYKRRVGNPTKKENWIKLE